MTYRLILFTFEEDPLGRNSDFVAATAMPSKILDISILVAILFFLATNNESGSSRECMHKIGL